MNNLQDILLKSHIIYNDVCLVCVYYSVHVNIWDDVRYYEHHYYVITTLLEDRYYVQNRRYSINQLQITPRTSNAKETRLAIRDARWNISLWNI